MYDQEIRFESQEETALTETSFNLGILPVTDDLIDRKARWLLESLLFVRAFQLHSDEEYAPTIYIDSGGGEVSQVLAALHLLEAMPQRLATVALGECFSAAVLLVAAGKPGERWAVEDTRFLIHEPSRQTSKNEQINRRESKAQGREDGFLDDLFVERLAALTRLDTDTIQAYSLDHRFFGPVEALEWGIIDRIGLPFDAT